MQWNDWVGPVYAALPDCQIEEDNDGQLIIYTGMRLSEDFPLEVVPFVPEDEEN